MTYTPMSFNVSTTYTEVKPIVAIDLGEDGGSWLVEGPEYISESRARYAVLTLLQEQFEEGSDEYLEQIEALAIASASHRSGWWANGYSEGYFVEDEEPPKKVEGWFIG